MDNLLKRARWRRDPVPATLRYHARALYPLRLFIPADDDLEPKGRRYPNGRAALPWEQRKEKET